MVIADFCPITKSTFDDINVWYTSLMCFSSAEMACHKSIWRS